MEQTKKHNFIPLIVLVLVLGIGAAALAKPHTDATEQKAAIGETTNAFPTSILGSLTGTGVVGKGSTDPATICETAWPTAAGQMAAKPNIPKLGEGEHVCGNPNASIVIVEYTDFECPYCKQFHPVLQNVVATSNGEIAWVLRHYPIDSLHSRARHEAEAAECAGEQQGDIGFWKYADKVFSVTSSNNTLSPDLLVPIATEQGLDKDAFSKCLASGKYLPKIHAQELLAEDNGPIGTPNSRLFMNGKQVDEIAGAVDSATLKAKIDLWKKVR